MYRAMGGPDSIQRWATQRPPLAQTDRVHLTATGYRLVAEALYEQLINEYNTTASEQPKFSRRPNT
ncbi:MAG TPA: hypothetical protein PLP53_07215, partial [Plasticicumulans sp.]|nr:hypothetical protein [Plasticicumulans sp.]